MKRAQENDAEAKQAARAAQTKVAEAKKTLASMESERPSALNQAAAARKQTDEAFAADQQAIQKAAASERLRRLPGQRRLVLREKLQQAEEAATEGRAK